MMTTAFVPVRPFEPAGFGLDGWWYWRAQQEATALA
jgi:hypothetical protein